VFGKYGHTVLTMVTLSRGSVSMSMARPSFWDTVRSHCSCHTNQTLRMHPYHMGTHAHMRTYLQCAHMHTYLQPRSVHNTDTDTGWPGRDNSVEDGRH
jgi:hypothetical protein